MTTAEFPPPPTKPPVKKLYRSRQQRMIAGVCGGLAEYFNVDVTVVRLLWVVITLFGGAGLLAYLILWLVVPPEPDSRDAIAPAPRSGSTALGVILVLAGLLLLAAWPGWWIALIPGATIALVIPGVVLALGLGLLLGWLLTRPRSESVAAPVERANPEERPRKLYRSRSNRVLSGVAGGMGEYFNLDPTIIRVLWVIFAVTSLGAAVLLYIILILVVPEEPLY